MPQEIINIGTTPNDGTGDSIRNAFNKSNNNFTELYEDIPELQSDISNLQSDVSDLQTDLTTVETDLPEIQTDISNLQSGLTTAQTDVAAVETSVGTVQTDLAAVETSVGTLETDLTEVQSDLSTVETSISTIQTDLSTVETNIGTVQTDLSTLETNLSTAQSDISDLQNNVTEPGNQTKPELVFYASDYGATGDGTTDDTSAIQAAINAAGSALDAQQNLGYSGPSQVRLAGGTFVISSQLIVKNGVTLIGETKNPPYPNRVSGFKSNNNLFTGTELLCTSGFVGENAILLEPDNTGVQDLILDGHAIEAGTTYPQVNVITASGRFYTTRPMKLNVNDPNDFRINSFKFDNIEIPVFILGKYMEYQLQGIGGDGNYSFSITNGILPTGLSMSSSGLITGTATNLQTNFPTFRIQDGGSETFSRIFTVATIVDEIKTRDINPSTVGATSSFQMETRWGNVGGLSWELVGDNLPTWVSISSSGLLTFSDTTTNDDAGLYPLKIRLLQNSDILDTRVYTHEVRFDNGSIRIFGEGTIRPQNGQAFSETYLANGGFGDYTWTINETRSNQEADNSELVTSTSPYPGLSLNPATGEISGSTTSIGKNIYYLRATSNFNTGIFFEGRFIIDSQSVGVTPLQVTRNLPTATVGVPYSFQVDFIDDPSDPIATWELVNPPTGLSIDSNGLITGTPVGANFVNGVRLQWSCSVLNLAIRGFNNGAGIFSQNPSNIHRIHRTMISVCDRGIGFNNQTFDSHFSDLYIFNCRVGMDLGPGAAGLTTSDSRIEFIHEDGVNMRTANENDFSSIYFDTCGWSSVRAVNSVNAVFVGCRSFRPGRLVRGTNVQSSSNANVEFSNHVYLENCNRFTFSGNSFDLGSDDGGDGIFLTDRLSDNLRPYVGFRLYNCKELTVVGNNLTGCVNDTFSANLTTFGENSFKGYRISDNSQTDKYLVPIDIKTEKENLYVPNQSFKAWQRDNEFNIPTSPNLVSFPIADYWTLTRGQDSVIDQPITVSRKTDGLKEFDKYYINIQKLANTTSPANNTQNLFLENVYSNSVSYTSNKGCVLSYWARSSNNNHVQPRISQYADSPDNSFASYQQTGGVSITSSRWVRYSHYFQLEDLEGVSLGDGAIFNIQFLLPISDQDYDIDIAGVQVDFTIQTPFAQKLRYDSLEEAIDYAQLKYQKSKDYDQYLPSWSDSLRYDVNGANFEPSYVLAYSPSVEGESMRTNITLDTKLPSHPGHPDTASVQGTLQNFKVLNPQRLTDRTSVDKYSFNGPNSPDAYVEQASRTSFTVSARNSTTDANTNYIFHWIYTDYDTDLNSSGGGYS